MNVRRTVWVALLATGLLSMAGASATVGLAIGYEPSGLMVFSAITETHINESIDLRAEAGLATNEIAGLMLATGTILYRYPMPPVEPYIGLGGGIAMTPPPFTTGIVAEAVGGVRIMATEAIVLFGQVRYLVRWSEGQVWPGPVFEAGLQFRF